MIFDSYARTALVGIAALLPAIPALSQSQSTLYGIVDLGIVSSDNGARGAGRVTGLSSGITSGSRIGFRGSEDLGNRLKAVFHLEMGLDADTGALKNYIGNYSTATPNAPAGVSSTGGFNRRSYVGLESRWGSIFLGRDYTPLYYTVLATDTFRLGHLGNVQALVALAGGSERLARTSNGIFYTSPNWGGWRMRAAYGFGSESAGAGGQAPRQANAFLGLGADLTLGHLTLSGAYQTLQLPLVTGSPAAFTGTRTRRDITVGAQYRLGPWLLAAGHFRVNGPQRGEDSWAGAGYTFGANTVKVQMQRLEMANPGGAQRRATMVAIAYEHALSKRSLLYASYARVNNNSTAQFGIPGSDISLPAGAAGAKPDAIALGLRHSF